MYTILVCDDENDIRAALSIYLKGEGYRVLEAGGGREALEILQKQEVQLILLDVMMPGMDGVTVLGEIRKLSNVPVILLTAKSEETDMVLGLTLGADDYITKPYRPLELMARVRAQLRRYANLGGLEQKEDTLSVGGISMDDRSKAVTLLGEPVALTPTEYDILKLLMENPGKVFSTAQIYRAVWREEPIGADGTVAVHVRHLREKLEADPSNPRYIKVVWGKGYRLEDKL